MKTNDAGQYFNRGKILTLQILKRRADDQYTVAGVSTSLLGFHSLNPLTVQTQKHHINDKYAVGDVFTRHLGFHSLNLLTVQTQKLHTND